MGAHLWLIGMMGAGKTTVGKRVAALLSVPFYDIDAEVGRRAGCSIARLWGEKGEAAFREMEAIAITAVADRPSGVVATGGGAILRESNVATMRASGTVIWLSVPVDELERRVGSDPSRPLLAEAEGIEPLSSLLEGRRARYGDAAHQMVDAAGRSVDEVVAEVEARWTGM